MKRGTAIERAFVCVLADGTTCVDWGDGRMQDVLTGEFRPAAEVIATHTVTDAELKALVQQGIATGYDANYAYLLPLPERPMKTIE
jgi:hypothetical protein